MFDQKLKKYLVLLILFYNVFILGCTKSEKTYNFLKTSKKSNSQQTNSDPSTKFKIHNIQGKLIYEQIPPGKSVRAYKGEDFLIMTNSKNQTKLVLLPSKQVSHSQLKSFHNQDVEITAIYQEGTRPDISKAPCVLDNDRQCMIQNRGYEVLSVKTK